MWKMFKDALCVAALMLAFVALCGHESTVQAGVASKAIQEALEFTTKKFSKEVAAEGVERLASKMSTLALKHSDDLVAQAVKRCGPRTVQLVETAGVHGDDMLRLLARHGDAAIPLATRKTSLGLVKKFGQEAGEACVKHGTIAEPVLHQFGAAGAKAMAQVSPRAGRQLAMLTEERLLKPELIDVVVRYGDKACDFIWRNKTTLAGSAALAAFVANPSGFLNGTAVLTGAIVSPLAAIPQAVAVETVKQVPWTILGLGFFGTLTAVLVCLSAFWNDRRKWLGWGRIGGKAAWLWLKSLKKP